MISADILGERTRLTPEKTALISVPIQDRFTYRTLNERAILCARMWMEACRLEKSDRVGILANNRVEYVDAFFAAGKSGIALVPLGTRLTAHELKFIIQDSGLKSLMYGREVSGVVQELKNSASLEFWIALDEKLDLSDIDYHASITGLSSKAWSSARCDPEDVYCLLYTSGTTGKPKGVMLPHRMIAWNAYNTAICWQLSENDVAPIFTPMYHAGGLSVFLTPIFAIGGTVVLHDRFDASEVWRTIEKEGCSVIFGVPTIFKMLMEAPEFSRVDLSGVRWCISGGAPLPLYVIEAYQRRGVAFKQGYGLTEVGVNCFSMTVEESRQRPGSVGKPMMFTEVVLMDAQGQEVPAVEVGELWIRGPHVSTGYWNNPRATEAALDPEGWFHTSDLARRDEEGFFYIAGRCKDMIISGGINVYPAEIEAELLLHPGVKDAAVVGIPDPKWGETGIAFLCLQENLLLTKEAMKNFLATRLAKYKIPNEFIVVESLPRTPYGKVIKGELREQYEQGSLKNRL
jgi:fatty-acyl-CoA synthase